MWKGPGVCSSNGRAGWGVGVGTGGRVFRQPLMGCREEEMGEDSRQIAWEDKEILKVGKIGGRSSLAMGS